MTVQFDFTSQNYLRNPAAGLERLRASGPVVEVRFPVIIGADLEMMGGSFESSPDLGQNVAHIGPLPEQRTGA